MEEENSTTSSTTPSEYSDNEVSDNDDDSYYSEDELDDVDEEYEEGNTTMPLLKYARIVGSLTREHSSSTNKTTAAGESSETKQEDNETKQQESSQPQNSSSGALKSACKCTAMGRVVVPAYSSTSIQSSSLSTALAGLNVAAAGVVPSASTVSNNNTNDKTSVSGTVKQMGKNSTQTGGGQLDECASTKRRIFHVMAMAMEDGTIHLLDPLSGKSICPPTQTLHVLTPKKNQNNNNNSSGRNQTASGGGEEAQIDIVDLSFDSGAHHLAALTSDGNVAIFELRYGVIMTTAISSTTSDEGNDQSRSDGATTTTSQSTVRQEPKATNAFDSFLSRLAGDDITTKPTTSTTDPSLASGTGSGTNPSPNNNSTRQAQDMNLNKVPMLTLIQPISTARFHYSLGSINSTNKESNMTRERATCLVLDPSYNRSNSKSLIVGFSNGRLVYTKHSKHGGVVDDCNGGSGSGGGGMYGGGFGNLFRQQTNQREDRDLHQSVVDTKEQNGGIEALTWRGSLVAWAESSGIKLYDTKKMTKIARIDRPTGARASLYPTVSSLKPTLLFERRDSLLVAWGDCLMNMCIKEVIKPVINNVTRAPKGGTAGPKQQQQTTMVKRQTVECEMAWELDCIACGVVPVDAEHVAILGLVPMPQDNDDDDDDDEDSQEKKMDIEDLDNEFVSISTGMSNLLELQIISRSEGTATCSDILPLVRAPSDTDPLMNCIDAAANYSFLSSYATSRMGDAFEAEVEEDIIEEKIDLDSLLNTMTSSLIVEDDNEGKRNKFSDPHINWNIEEGKEDGTASESESLENFIFHPKKVTKAETGTLQDPPIMIITSLNDVVLSQIRDIDDAISFARQAGNHALALRHGLENRRRIRRHSLNTLINDYFSSILFPSTMSRKNGFEPSSPLTIEQLKMAAKATPILFGGNIHMWESWAHKFSKIPGGLYILWEYLPVRDPRLPSRVYNFVLQKMFQEIESMFADSDYVENTNNAFMVSSFMKVLRVWGSVSSLKERMKLHNPQGKYPWEIGLDYEEEENKAQGVYFNDAENALSLRMTQSAASYLKYEHSEGSEEGRTASSIMPNIHSMTLPAGVTPDPLFSIDNVLSTLEPYMNQSNEDLNAKGVSTSSPIYTATLEATAELYFMNGEYQKALEYSLKLGAYYSLTNFSELENQAIKSTREKKPFSYLSQCPKTKTDKYQHILTMIETHQLHGQLLRENFIHNSDVDISIANVTPVIALIHLVGLKLCGRFLLEHCTLPNSKIKPSATDESESSVLPIDLLASQLRSCPKLLFWYLHLVFCHKPEVYVKFPNTAVPPSSVTDLHRSHFDLHVEFTDKSIIKKRRLTDVPIYDDVIEETQMMSFLKSTLPHGGIRYDDVRRTLEACRLDPKSPESGELEDSNKIKHPHLFARELAFIIERSGSLTDDDAKEVLGLYLDGAVSLPLAVAYIERKTSHSAMLWEFLVSYCLEKDIGENGDGEKKESNGPLFGSLLEVAARSGADLAHLVSKIPAGMRIEGIRPRLVTAISDYRLKLKIHEASSSIFSNDKISLLRDQYHRARRGLRVDLPSHMQGIVSEEIDDDDTFEITKVAEEAKVMTSQEMLQLKRKERHLLTYRKQKSPGISQPQSLTIK